MKNEFIKIGFNKDETWSITPKLRFIERETIVLQQLYISNLGNEKWVDVPTKTE